jgi:hypothetical protein
MRLKRWYFGVIIFWIFTGLPLYTLGQGIAGRSPLDVSGFLTQGDVPIDSIGDFLSWVVIVVLIALPLITLPFAFRRKTSS